MQTTLQVFSLFCDIRILSRSFVGRPICYRKSQCLYSSTCLGRPPSERTPAMYGHVINVPTHFNVKLPAIGGHLPNADADSHLLVVRTCYNGQFKQMPRFRRSFQPKIARGGHPNLRPTFCSNVHAAIW